MWPVAFQQWMNLTEMKADFILLHFSCQKSVPFDASSDQVMLPLAGRRGVGCSGCLAETAARFPDQPGEIGLGNDAENQRIDAVQQRQLGIGLHQLFRIIIDRCPCPAAEHAGRVCAQLLLNVAAAAGPCVWRCGWRAPWLRKDLLVTNISPMAPMAAMRAYPPAAVSLVRNSYPTRPAG